MVKIHYISGLVSFLIEAERIDSTNATEVTKLLTLPGELEVTAVQVDLLNVEAMDSSGIGAILHLHKKLPAELRPLALANVRPAVASVIELLQLHRVFRLIPSTAD